MDPNKHSNNSARMAQLQHLLKQRQEHHYNMSSMFASQQEGMARSHLIQNYPASNRNTNLVPPIRKERKKYAPNACTNCRNLHLSCAVVRPCPRCVASGKSDCCVTVYKKRGRPTKSAQIAAAAAAVIKASKEGVDENESGSPSTTTRLTQTPAPGGTDTGSDTMGEEKMGEASVKGTTSLVPSPLPISNSAQLHPSTFTPETTAPSPSKSDFLGNNHEQPLAPPTSTFAHSPSPLKKRQYTRKFKVEKRVMHPIAKHPKFVPYRHPAPLLPRFPPSYHLPSLIHYPCGLAAAVQLDMYRPCIGVGMASACPAMFRKVDFYGHPMGSLETLLEAIEVREKQEVPVNDMQLSASASTLNSGASSSLTLASCSSSSFMPMLCGPECEHFTSTAGDSFIANPRESRIKRSSATFTTSFKNAFPLPDPKSNMYNTPYITNSPIFNPGPRIPPDADMCIETNATDRTQKEPQRSAVSPSQSNFTADGVCTGGLISPKKLPQNVHVPVHVSKMKSLAIKDINPRTETADGLVEMDIVDADPGKVNTEKGGEHGDEITGSIDQQVKDLRLSAPARVQDDSEKTMGNIDARTN